MVARVRGGTGRRRQVFDHLHAAGIHAQVHYVPVHTQPWYQKHTPYRIGDFPAAESYYESAVSLPLYPRMSDGDAERVAMTLREAVRSTSHGTTGTSSHARSGSREGLS
jgi:dTDP-4-amino-4,6-dideoxygalactose transaminase